MNLMKLRSFRDCHINTELSVLNMQNNLILTLKLLRNLLKKLRNARSVIVINGYVSEKNK